MKILLSAYACEPGKGSESGVGWNYALELDRLGHEVHVLTRVNNGDQIEAECAARLLGVRVHRYDLPLSLRFWKRGRRGLYLYYLLWQMGASRKAARLNAEHRFDLVHHVTLGSATMPSFMGRLGVPFLLGPLGGGETAPLPLRQGYSLRGHVVDRLRDAMRFVAKHNPLISQMQAPAAAILLRTPESIGLIRPQYRDKVVVVRDVGAPEVVDEAGAERRPYSLLYVGRFLHWKGLHLAIGAVALLRRTIPDIRLTLVGAGPEETHLRRLAERLEVTAHLDWIDWLPQEKMRSWYLSHDLFLFPSLHDSGGSVVLEALSHGLPVVCFDLGGPARIVDPRGGLRVDAGGSRKDAETGLAQAVETLLSDRRRLASLRLTARACASESSWAATVQAAYGALGGDTNRLAQGAPR